MTLTVGSLFAGVGGLEAGLELAGLGPVLWQAELDPCARAVLAKHWQDVPRYDDITLMVEDVMAGKLKKLTQEQAIEAVRMYDAGASCGDIGSFYGITRSAMWQMLSRRTTMRSRERYGADNHFYRGGVRAADPAQNIIEKAILRGKVVPAEQCEACGVANQPFADGRRSIQAHHDDYNKPLSVRWLCQPCHHEWHKCNVAIRKEVPVEVPAVDVICGGFP